MSRAKLSSIRSLQLLTSDGVAGLYPQAEIYLSGASSPITTLDLTDLGNGRYAVDYTFPTIGQHFVKYIVYSDSEHTTKDTTYSEELEDILVEVNNLDSLPTSVMNFMVDSARTFKQFLRIVASAVAGKASSGPSTTKFRDLEDTRDVITTVANTSGDRTSATYDPGS